MLERAMMRSTRSCFVADGAGKVLISLKDCVDEILRTFEGINVGVRGGGSL